MQFGPIKKGLWVLSNDTTRISVVCIGKNKKNIEYGFNEQISTNLIFKFFSEKI